MTSIARQFQLTLRLDNIDGQMVDVGYVRDVVRSAEAHGVAAVLLADSLGVMPGKAATAIGAALEPLTLLAAVSAVTSRIGLVAPVSTTFSQPYNIARRLSGLDHISRGRAGWLPQVTRDRRSANNFDLTDTPNEDLDARCAEFVDVVVSLWDSWEDDARVIDKAAGIYVDPARVHRIDHHGAHFRVAGPIDTPRPPQGNPVLFHTSPLRLTAGLARAVDVVIGDVFEPAAVRQTHHAVSAALGVAGRHRSGVRILAQVALDRAGQEWGEVVTAYEDGFIDGVTLIAQARSAEVIGRLVRVVSELGGLGPRPSSPAVTTLRDNLGLSRPVSRYAVPA